MANKHKLEFEEYDDKSTNDSTLLHVTDAGNPFDQKALETKRVALRIAGESASKSRRDNAIVGTDSSGANASRIIGMLEGLAVGGGSARDAADEDAPDAPNEDDGEELEVVSRW